MTNFHAGRKELKKWNGRIPNEDGRLMIAAKNKEDAYRLLMAQFPWLSRDHWVRELKNYFSECWGDDMSGIKVERGIWISPGSNYPHPKPRRIFPKFRRKP